jgi:HK97 family phage portal protein
MSIWWRKPEKRSTPLWASLTAPWIATSSYADVDGSRMDAAMQSVAVRASVDLIASLCSELPIDIYSGKGPNRAERPMPGYLEDPAGDGYGLPDWIYRVVVSEAYRGNLFGEVLERDPRGGFIRQMELFHPDTVTGQMKEGAPAWYVNGKRYEGPGFKHERINPMPGQILGLSPISLHATTIGVTLATSRFGKQYFDDGANPSGIFRNTEANVTPDQAKTIKDRFMAALRGVREPVVVGKAWEWKQLTIAPEESQFLGTMGFTEAQCARIFGPGLAEILGYETGGSMTYANVQDRDIQLLKYTINRWLRRLERLLFQFLPRPQWVEFNRDALLQTNTVARYQAYSSALGGKPWKVVNEIRDIENLQPVSWGNGDPSATNEPSADPADPMDPNQ